MWLSMFFVTAFAGSNEPIPENILGNTANYCAQTFCNEKDGLQLWLSLYQSKNIEYVEHVWTPLQTANICVMIAITGFTLGFLIEKFIVEYIKEE